LHPSDTGSDAVTAPDTAFRSEDKPVITHRDGVLLADRFTGTTLCAFSLVKAGIAMSHESDIIELHP